MIYGVLETFRMVHLLEQRPLNRSFTEVSLGLAIYLVSIAGSVERIFTPYTLLGLIVVFILLVGLIVLRMSTTVPTSRKKGPKVSQLAEKEASEAPETPPSSDSNLQPLKNVPLEDPVTDVEEDTTWGGDETSPFAVNLLRKDQISASRARELEDSEPEVSMEIWKRLGKISEAARCASLVEKHKEAGYMYISAGMSEAGAECLEKALEKSPTDENIRLRLVETYFDLGKTTKAFELIDAVIEGPSDFKASGKFLESIAHDLEALHQIDEAEKFYRIALDRSNSLPEVQQRLLFIKHMRRLSAKFDGDDGENTPLHFLAKAAEDSNIPGVTPEIPTNVGNGRDSHEIIVGHLALGFEHDEPSCSVRSYYSISRRFILEGILAESPRAAVFKARDRLLDFPVALKLYRLPTNFGSLEDFRSRMLAVAQLNHPNLGKITLVDREGQILRVATEYLPGGNLSDFLNKLGGVGLPLIIRMAMHITSALHTAHTRGVPHGDIRPENMLIGQDQRIKIVDFALTPIPVLIPEDPDLDTGSSDYLLPSEENGMTSEGIKGDLLQFADVLEFMLEHTRKASDPSLSPALKETEEDLRDLVEKIRKGSFKSILSLWQILHEIFERTLPQKS